MKLELSQTEIALLNEFKEELEELVENLKEDSSIELTQKTLDAIKTHISKAKELAKQSKDIDDEIATLVAEIIALYEDNCTLLNPQNTPQTELPSNTLPKAKSLLLAIPRDKSVMIEPINQRAKQLAEQNKNNANVKPLCDSIVNLAALLMDHITSDFIIEIKEGDISVSITPKDKDSTPDITKPAPLIVALNEKLNELKQTIKFAPRVELIPDTALATISQVAKYSDNQNDPSYSAEQANQTVIEKKQEWQTLAQNIENLIPVCKHCGLDEFIPIIDETIKLCAQVKQECKEVSCYDAMLIFHNEMNNALTQKYTQTLNQIKITKLLAKITSEPTCKLDEVTKLLDKARMLNAKIVEIPRLNFLCQCTIELAEELVNALPTPSDKLKSQTQAPKEINAVAQNANTYIETVVEPMLQPEPKTLPAKDIRAETEDYLNSNIKLTSIESWRRILTAIAYATVGFCLGVAFGCALSLATGIVHAPLTAFITGIIGAFTLGTAGIPADAKLAGRYGIFSAQQRYLPQVEALAKYGKDFALETHAAPAA